MPRLSAVGISALQGGEDVKARILRRALRAGITLELWAGLGACAGYAPRPWPDGVIWRQPARMRVDARHTAVPALASKSPSARLW